jgi:cysteine synthase A
MTPIFTLNDIKIKLEYLNPSQSTKDRPAKAFCKEAFLKGYKEIVEATSGNTGIALGFYASKMNLKATIFMPKSYSIERQKLLKLYGANLILVDGNMSDAINEAKEYAKKYNAYLANQFQNPLNPSSQQETALEILSQTSLPEYFVCAVGSGGSLSGIASILKPLGTKIIAVESKNSPVIHNRLKNKNLPIKPHKIQGIGAGFIPKTLNLELIDDVVLVDDDEAIEFTKKLPSLGINGGISTAANILASMSFKNSLTLAPDSIERYLSVL